MRTPHFLPEPLEGRKLLAATAVLNSRGIFKITGTDDAETIELALNSAGDMVQATLGGTLLGEAEVDAVRAIQITSLGGNDTVTVADTLEDRVLVRAGSGDDTVTVNSPRAVIYGGEGLNTLIANGDGPTTIVGGDDKDVITVADGRSLISAGFGDDSITVGNGRNRIDAGDGNDSVTAGTGSNVISLGDGNDTVTAGSGGEGLASIYGGDGDDSITFAGETSYLFGGAGADTITGSDTGADTIYGGGNPERRARSGGGIGSRGGPQRGPGPGGGGGGALRGGFARGARFEPTSR